jgi:hypothetical protein
MSGDRGRCCSILAFVQEDPSLEFGPLQWWNVKYALRKPAMQAGRATILAAVIFGDILQSKFTFLAPLAVTPGCSPEYRTIMPL